MVRRAPSATCIRDGYNLAADHMDLARRIVYQIARGLPPHADVDGLAGAALEGLCDAASRWDPARGPFRPYASLRIRGAVIDETRRADMFSIRRKAGPQFVELEDRWSVDEPGFARVDEAPGLAAASRLLAVAAARLPARSRMVFTLYFFEGLYLKAIASAWGLTEARISQLASESAGYVRSYLHHPAVRVRL